MKWVNLEQDRLNELDAEWIKLRMVINLLFMPNGMKIVSIFDDFRDWIV